MSALVIGGTSGLGLEIAHQLRGEHEEPVIVTGRHDPNVEGLEFRKFGLSALNLPQRIGELILSLPPIDTLVYAAGYYQEGRISDLDDEEIENMLNVGGRGLIYALNRTLKVQDELGELITVTSTSQWVPRKLEPIYNFVKAGEAHLSNAMAEDERVGKVLVVAPAGMRTNFWEGIDRDDLDEMLDPAWVAEKTIGLRKDDYRYRFAKIMRKPPSVNIVETR